MPNLGSGMKIPTTASDRPGNTGSNFSNPAHFVSSGRCLHRRHRDIVPGCGGESTAQNARSKKIPSRWTTIRELEQLWATLRRFRRGTTLMYQESDLNLDSNRRSQFELKSLTISLASRTRACSIALSPPPQLKSGVAWPPNSIVSFLPKAFTKGACWHAAFRTPLFPLQVRNVLVVLVADIFQQFRVHHQRHRLSVSPRLGVRPGIVDGRRDVHVSEVTPAEALSHVQRLRGRMAQLIQPHLAAEARGLDHQRVPVPLA